eukprot:24435-Rhodomonas_salina.1
MSLQGWKAYSARRKTAPGICLCTRASGGSWNVTEDSEHCLTSLLIPRESASKACPSSSLSADSVDRVLHGFDHRCVLGTPHHHITTRTSTTTQKQTALSSNFLCADFQRSETQQSLRAGREIDSEI